MILSIHELAFKSSSAETRFLAREHLFISANRNYGRGYVSEGVLLRLHPEYIEVGYFISTFNESMTRENVIDITSQLQIALREIKSKAPWLCSKEIPLSASVNHDYSGGSIRLCEIDSSGEFIWVHPSLKYP